MVGDNEKNRLSKIITRGGDKGLTSLGGGKRVPKDSLRLETYGTVDELNSFIGLVRVHPLLDGSLQEPLQQIQQDLFALGGELCFEEEEIKEYAVKTVNSTLVDRLEKWANEKNSSMPPLKEFILPTGPAAAAELHVCRTICRRAERLAVTLSREEGVNAEIVKYLNRLSDLLFIWARWVHLQQGDGMPTLWNRNG